MFINFWYPVCTTAELTPDKPVRAQILGLPFVAFRDAEGRANVLSDTCVHRGGALHAGKVVGGRIACPYHGWQFDGTGKCTLVPSLGRDGNIPARAKVDAYPVEERYGIVFAFLGDLPADQRCPLYEIREWGQPGWRDSGLVILDVATYYERSMENGLDPAHNEFVHDLQGNIKFRPERMKLTEDEWTSTVFARMDPPDTSKTQLNDLRNDMRPEDFGASTYHHGANTLVTRINLSAQNCFVQYFFEQPVDEGRTRIFFVNMRNCMLDEKSDERIRKINVSIAEEDIRVITRLSPVRTPESPTKELLVVGDEGVGAYRRHLREWERRGWRIDRKKLRETAGDVAYAIPCPGRRESKNWVLDAVPLVPASAAAVVAGAAAG
jgi:phenylpropionate dioxygenase-like ring-hydroxylating dioxygenase large terminal subunit